MAFGCCKPESFRIFQCCRIDSDATNCLNCALNSSVERFAAAAANAWEFSIDDGSWGWGCTSWAIAELLAAMVDCACETNESTIGKDCDCAWLREL